MTRGFEVVAKGYSHCINLVQFFSKRRGGRGWGEGKNKQVQYLNLSYP
jgi:hypothetical protein